MRSSSVGADVDRVAEPGRDPQRAALAATADDDRQRPDRPGVRRGLGQPRPGAGVRLGAGGPERPHRLDRVLEQVEPLAVGRERQPEAGVLALPPAGADARRTRGRRRARRASPPPSRSRPAGRKDTGVQSVPSRSPVPSAARWPSVTHGSGIGSQARPTCGIWMRWSISARPAKPAASAASATSRSQVAGSSPHGKRETWSTTSTPMDVRRSVAAAGTGAGGGGTASAVDGHRVDDVPALVRQGGLDVPHRPQLPGQHRRRDRPVASGVAATALGLRGGQQHRHGRQPGGPARGQPGQPPGGIGAEGVHHRAQPAAQPGGHDRLQQGERVRRGVQVVRAAADHAAQRVGGDDLLAAVALLGPGGLARAGGADEDDQRGVGEASGAQPNSSVSGSAEDCSSGRDHGVTGRGTSSPSTTRSVRSFQNARWSRTRAASSSGSG